MKLKAIIATALALSFVPAAGQQRTAPPPEPKGKGTPQQQEEVVTVTTNLVQVDVVVTDKEDKPVTDLLPEDFEVFEGKKRQQITNFSFIATGGAAAGASTASSSPAGVKATAVPPAPIRPEQVRRTVAIVVDDLGLSFESVGYVQKALRKFVEEQMQPGDQVAIIRTSGDTGALQQITSDRRQLQAAIENVRWNPAGRGGLSPFQQATDQKESLGVNENSDDNPMRGIRKSQEFMDQMERERGDIYAVGTFNTLGFVINGLKELPGRKSIIFISESFRLFSSQGRNLTLMQLLRRLTDQANLASTVIYTLDASGLQDQNLNASDKVAGTGYLFDKRILTSGTVSPGAGAGPAGRPSSPQLGVQRADLGAQAEVDSVAAFRRLDALASQREQQTFESQSVLSFLAQQTGGLFARNRNDLSGGLQRMMNDQSGYYLIGYRPEQQPIDPATGQRRFHDITVKVGRPGLRVRARAGYYGLTDESGRPARRTREEQLAAALVSPFNAGGVGLRLTSLFGSEEGKGSFLRSLLHIEARDLTFSDESDGGHNAAIDLIAVNFGDNGRVIDQFSHTHTISLRGDAYQQALQNGLVFNFDFPVKEAGAYQMRVAVRDSASARVGSARQFVEVPDVSKNYLALSGLIVKGLTPSVVKTAPGDGLPAGTQAAGAVAAADDPQADPAVRRLRQGMMLDYRYAIYNAQLDPATNRPQLTTQMRLFRDGKEVFTGRVLPFDPGKQTDMKRLGAGGRLRLGSELIPGDYFLQIMVTDALTKGKNRTATQWIDFEIVN